MTHDTQEALLREIAAESVRAAKDAGYQVGSYAFGSFIKGQWQVIADKHPQLAAYRFTFLEAAGATK